MAPVRLARLLVVIALSTAPGLLLGCSRADSAPPVAKVTVTPNRTKVGLGGPLELKFRFEVASGAAIRQDYRVFVHVLTADRQPIWNDDHDPPVPTSSWKPGQVVEYTRFRFVPVIASPGDALVEVGLYAGDRLPLEGPDPASRESRAREYRVAAVQLVPESENVFLRYTSGWQPEEFSPDDPAMSWKWMKKSAVLSMKNPRADSVLFLQYDARPDLFPGHPQQVTVYANNQVIQTFTADSPDVRLRQIPLLPSQLGAADMVDLRLEVDQTFVPSSLPNGDKDDRELGLRFYHVFVDRR